MHRGFLKPIEISLKTYKTEQKEEDNKLKPNSLPSGLKIVIKESITQNKYELANVKEIDWQRDNKLKRSGDTFQVMRMQNKNNILSLMKKEKGIELAICVCMYSQDSKMLKSTLAGIEENIANMVAQSNLISSDQIGVFVLMDGI